MPTLKGTEVSLSYVQCFSYLIPSSIKCLIFLSTWLDTFWTDLIYKRHSVHWQVRNLCLNSPWLYCYHTSTSRIQKSTSQVKFLGIVWVDSQCPISLAIKEQLTGSSASHHQKGSLAHCWTLGIGGSVALWHVSVARLTAA